MISTPTPSTPSLWWNDPGAARHLHAAAVLGATIRGCSEFWGTQHDDVASDGMCDDWMLDIEFRRNTVHVRYSSETGFWRLIVDTDEPPMPTTAADQVALAFVVEKAARLTTDLNKIIERQQRQSVANLISDEVTDIMATSGMTMAEFAAQLGTTHGMLCSRLNGATPWSAVDMLRIYRIAGPERVDTIARVIAEAEGVTR